jgi:hypothetical protein
MYIWLLKAHNLQFIQMFQTTGISAVVEIQDNVPDLQFEFCALLAASQSNTIHLGYQLKKALKISIVNNLQTLCYIVHKK